MSREGCELSPGGGRSRTAPPELPLYSSALRGWTASTATARKAAGPDRGETNRDIPFTSRRMKSFGSSSPTGFPMGPWRPRPLGGSRFFRIGMRYGNVAAPAGLRNAPCSGEDEQLPYGTRAKSSGSGPGGISSAPLLWEL